MKKILVCVAKVYQLELVKLLVLWGYDVLQARTFQECIDMTLTHKPDLVVINGRHEGEFLDGPLAAIVLRESHNWKGPILISSTFVPSAKFQSVGRNFNVALLDNPSVEALKEEISRLVAQTTPA